MIFEQWMHQHARTQVAVQVIESPSPPPVPSRMIDASFPTLHNALLKPLYVLASQSQEDASVSQATAHQKSVQSCEETPDS
ncbi:hypothetical protein KOR42_40310 [Thalassoglobus neptunius]|uniref:Uncharacterized protein n=1 Tax=Thalassoglobus neptunius TaxID=1938619 RepID=A0A5C5WC48_9PLAN|nr:hypothetical protein KOR42_40310 [Thalassoglobus neptunius]